jgi:hypothetical protein
MALWIAVAAGVFSATAPATSDNGRAEPLLEIVPEEIVGIALYPDGITPVAELPIRLWSEARQRVIFRTQTAADGTFRVPRTAAGPCFLFVGRVKMNLRMLPPSAGGTYQQHDIIIVVPRSLVVGQGLPQAGIIMGTDVLIAPFLFKPPRKPPVVSP